MSHSLVNQTQRLLWNYLCERSLFHLQIFQWLSITIGSRKSPVDLKSVHPLFLHGSDPEEPELGLIIEPFEVINLLNLFHGFQKVF